MQAQIPETKAAAGFPVEIRAKAKRLFMHFVIPIYWVLLMLWQILRPVENRSITDIGVKALLLGSLLSYVVLKSYCRKINLTGLLFLILYTLLQVLSHLNNYDLFKISCIIDIIFSFCIIFAFLILNNDYVITKDELILFSRIIVGIVFVLCIYADLFQFDKIIAAINTKSGYFNAVSSIVATNHEFGLYLSFGITSCGFLLFNSKGTLWKKIKYYFLIALFFFNMILTFSRTSLASVILATAIAIFAMKKHRLAFFCLTFLMIIGILLNDNLKDFIFNIVLRVHHDGNREVLVRGGLSYYIRGSIRDILIGVGPSQTVLYAGEISDSVNFHNAYITILLNGGLAMMMFFLYIVVDNLGNGFKVLRYSRCDGAYMLAVCIVMLLYMWGQTPVIFSPDLVSSMLTFYCIIIPKYYYNYHRSEIKGSNNSKTAINYIKLCRNY